MTTAAKHSIIRSIDVTVKVTACYQCPHFKDGMGWGDDYCRHPNYKGRFINNCGCIDTDCPYLKGNG